MRYAPTPHLRAQDEHIGSDSRTEVRGWPRAWQRRGAARRPYRVRTHFQLPACV